MKNKTEQPAIDRHTATVVKTPYQIKVLIVGGEIENGSEYENSKNITYFEFPKDIHWWVLHYLFATGIRRTIGMNMCQEIIELIFENEKEAHGKPPVDSHKK